MAKFKTNLEVILANEKECETYCETASRKINMLLEKYDVRNSEGLFAEVSADELKPLLSCSGFFHDTPLKSIFFGQHKQFVPHEIIQAYRSFISAPPANIKAFVFNNFIAQLEDIGWDKSLSTYFETEHNFAAGGIAILDDIKDFSLGRGVYRVTFQLRHFQRDSVIIFLKKSHDSLSYNELLYFDLQKQLLPTASHAMMPCILSTNENKQELLLCPQIPGMASDTVLTILTQSYRGTEINDYRSNLLAIIEVLIEAFITHAVLGDLLGRNDRHLMNSLTAFVIDGAPQNNTLDDLYNPEKISLFARNIAIQKTRALSLIDIDLKWLLDEKNMHWVLADIDFGLSELNLLSLLDEFNDYNPEEKLFFEKRQQYVEYYFNVYSQTQKFILSNKELLFISIKRKYPPTISESKLKILMKTIHFFEDNNTAIIELFTRYLLNYRVRLAHKTTLIALESLAKNSNNMGLLHALKEADLLNYIPPQAGESSVLLQLQCFRGVLSKNDMIILSEKDRTCWETIATNIAVIAKKFSTKLCDDLEKKAQFIKEDTAALLAFTQPSEAISLSVHPSI